MKHVPRTFLSFLFFCYSIFAFAQDKTTDTQALLKQGVDLQNAGKYPEAIEKFTEVLKADPENSYANYAMAYSLYGSKKVADAVPYLQKAVKAPGTNVQAAAYSLLGSIYDESHQTPKAIDAYTEVVKINPNYPQIFYNIGIAYSRNQQYAEAETSAIEAIRHNPANTSNYRLYALVTFHQNKRVNALMGFCSFLLLEPQTQRSAEAFTNIQSILKGGALKNDAHNSAPPSEADANEKATLNTGITVVITGPQAKKLTGMELTEYELKGIFNLAGQLANKKTDQTFFDRFFSDYFYKLSKSNNMPAFTRLISLSANKEANTKWQQDHAQQVTDLNDWIKNTPRDF